MPTPHQAAHDVAAHATQTDQPDLHAQTLSSQGTLDRIGEHRQAGLGIAGDVHAQRTAIPFGKHFEISARLRSLDDAERGFISRDREILRVMSGNLQEDAGIRPAFVGLSGRMQEARPEAQAGRDPKSLPD